MDESVLWSMLWMALCAGCIWSAWASGRKKLYLAYFVTGVAFGFYFDVVSFAMGYYSYPGFYRLTLLGIPLSMTVAEGFSVTIAIRLYEVLSSSLARKKA